MSINDTDEIIDNMGQLLKIAAIHQIIAGDTLVGIASTFGMLPADLIAANPNINPTALQIGQQIKIPTPVELQEIRNKRRLPEKNNTDLRTQIEVAIKAACSKNGIDEGLFRGLITVESRGDICAQSSSGAQGLCQLMPPIQQQMGVQNPFDPIQSIYGATKWLQMMFVEAKQLLGKYSNTKYTADQLALMLYNAGGPQVSAFLSGKNSLSKETLTYPNKVFAARGTVPNYYCSKGVPPVV